MKGIFGPYVLWPLDKKLIFWIVTRASARDYTVYVLFWNKWNIMYKLETGYFDIEIILSINNVKFMKKLYSAQQCIA